MRCSRRTCLVCIAIMHLGSAAVVQLPPPVDAGHVAALASGAAFLAQTLQIELATTRNAFTRVKMQLKEYFSGVYS